MIGTRIISPPESPLQPSPIVLETPVYASVLPLPAPMHQQAPVAIRDVSPHRQKLAQAGDSDVLLAIAQILACSSTPPLLQDYKIVFRSPQNLVAPRQLAHSDAWKRRYPQCQDG